MMFDSSDGTVKYHTQMPAYNIQNSVEDEYIAMVDFTSKWTALCR